ncbi:MAG: type II toxin-antitoxin system death-on-curing family toxin [Planctomycetota bacterium]
MRYLSTADVLILHGDTLEHEGGIVGVRDLGLLESAVATPRQEMFGVDLHPGLGAKAAAYLYHIAMNHPFFDGNKRAAALAALVFLDANGAVLPEPDELEAITLDVASGRVAKDALVLWMRERVGN